MIVLPFQTTGPRRPGVPGASGGQLNFCACCGDPMETPFCMSPSCLCRRWNPLAHSSKSCCLAVHVGELFLCFILLTCQWHILQFLLQRATWTISCPLLHCSDSWPGVFHTLAPSMGRFYVLVPFWIWVRLLDSPIQIPRVFNICIFSVGVDTHNLTRYLLVFSILSSIFTSPEKTVFLFPVGHHFLSLYLQDYSYFISVFLLHMEIHTALYLSFVFM